MNYSLSFLGSLVTLLGGAVGLAIGYLFIVAVILLLAVPFIMITFGHDGFTRHDPDKDPDRLNPRV